MIHSNSITIQNPLSKSFSRYAICFILIFTQSIANAVYAQGNTLERQIKATFLYKFGNYIDWPEGTFEHEDEPLTIGIIGADDIAADLREITRDKTIKGRMVIVRTFTPTDSLQKAQILFIGQSEQTRLNLILASTRGRPVVTVTESEDRIIKGGIINFIIDENKVRFDIELENADNNNIKISARLLGVARKVIAGSAS